MNDVLVAFMLSKLSGLIHSRDTTEEFLESDIQRKDETRPQFGDYDRAEADFDERCRIGTAAWRAKQGG
jgi:hypothetical protein